MKRVVALEKTRRPAMDTHWEAFNVSLDALSPSELILAEVALGLICGVRTWTDFEDRDWRHNPMMIAAKCDIEGAECPDIWRSVASAIVTRGHRRRLGKLEDMKSSFDEGTWAAIKALAAEMRSGVTVEDAIWVRQPALGYRR